MSFGGIGFIRICLKKPKSFLFLQNAYLKNVSINKDVFLLGVKFHLTQGLNTQADPLFSWRVQGECPTSANILMTPPSIN